MASLRPQRQRLGEVVERLGQLFDERRLLLDPLLAERHVRVVKLRFDDLLLVGRVAAAQLLVAGDSIEIVAGANAAWPRSNKSEISSLVFNSGMRCRASHAPGYMIWRFVSFSRASAHFSAAIRSSASAHNCCCFSFFSIS